MDSVTAQCAKAPGEGDARPAAPAQVTNPDRPLPGALPADRGRRCEPTVAGTPHETPAVGRAAPSRSLFPSPRSAVVLETAKLDPRFPQTNQTKVGGARRQQGVPQGRGVGAAAAAAASASSTLWPA